MEYKISGHTLEIQTAYEDFGSFMDETRDPVYRTIFSAFKELMEKKTPTVTVTVRAHVDNMDVESVLEFSKENSNMLTEIILPYFESVEEYEMCSEVLKIHKKLIRQ